VSDLADIGVIGGTGFYEFLDSAKEIRVETPFGATSDPVVIGEVGSKRVAFVPRHGRDHRFPPHKIPYRANLWALRSVGVRQVLAPSAVGSLTASYGPGTLAVPDQLVDRTTSRAQTFYDVGAAVHVQFADPYCPIGRGCAINAAKSTGWEPAENGTLVVIEGPRFSTRAESRWYAAHGWTLIGMTALPEAVLARELALCYTTIALVTDTDAGVEEGDGVTHEEVFRVFAANVGKLRDLVVKAVEDLPLERTCQCQYALDGLRLPIELP
jgi:5'-methylthioadenosine phosphorylase